MTERFKIGQEVRVTGQRRKAVIERFVPRWAKGAVVLDRPIDGFRWWNVQDLTPWKARKIGERQR